MFSCSSLAWTFIYVINFFVFFFFRPLFFVQYNFSLVSYFVTYYYYRCLFQHISLRLYSSFFLDCCFQSCTHVKKNETNLILIDVLRLFKKNSSLIWFLAFFLHRYLLHFYTCLCSLFFYWLTSFFLYILSYFQ